MEYVASISYGKDSLAMLEAIRLLKLPLDKIVTADILATKDLDGDMPEMVEFKKYADDVILQKYGLKVEHVNSGTTFEEQFYTKKEKGKHIGDIYGFPLSGRAWCNDRLKMKALKKLVSPFNLNYIGIAADETERIERHKDKENYRMPLVEIGWTEQDCYDWCSTNELLSPVYAYNNRGGCWFCSNQPIGVLRNLYHEYPDLWSRLLKWDADSPTDFVNHKRVKDFDERFKLEDAGKIKIGKSFRWSDLNN